MVLISNGSSMEKIELHYNNWVLPIDEMVDQSSTKGSFGKRNKLKINS